MRNFIEYHQDYIKTHPIPMGNKQLVLPKNNLYYLANFKKYLPFIFSLRGANNFSLLLIPLIFTFVLDLIIFQNEKDSSLFSFNKLNSTIINQTYSEKLIERIVIDKSIIINAPNDLKISSLNLSNNKNNFLSNKNNILIKKNHSNINNLRPLDLSLIKWEKNYSKKKIKFIKTLLPIIAYQNQKIVTARKKLFEIKKYIEINKTLKFEDIEYLKNISSKYLINFNSKHKVDLIDELLIAVDIIPNSIVLAQAANESGWGTSRFAKEHNALFGQYTYDKKNGVIPYEREEGKTHLIRNFESIDKSVESYFHNINTNLAYLEFRIIRNQLSSKKIKNSIKLLTKTLEVYAEDESYVKILNSIIDSNNLNQFDSIILPFIKS